MPVMTFDLEDGEPPVSFSINTEGADRFMAFMAECQSMREALPLLKQLKRDLMHARRFSPDTLNTYRTACTSAECDIEEFLKGGV